MPKKKVAICQLLIEGGEPQRNINRAEIYIKKASENNCDLIILPECSDLGWTHPSALDEAETIPGKWSDIYCDFSKKFKISICVGLTEKSENCIYNSAIYIESGKIINLHRKINILKEAKKFYACGKKIEVFNSNLGNCAISICSDNYKKSSIIPHVISRMQADIIISPSSWTIENDNTEESPYEYKWAETMEKVTNDYQNIFISATSVGYIVGGPFEGKKMVGRSLAFQNGKKILVMKNNEISTEMQIIEINISNEQRNYGTEISEKIDIKI